LIIARAWRKRPVARAYATVFAIAIAADVPERAVDVREEATAVGVFFVIFGDFRYFVVFEKACRK
jgi:hypothetical protein